MATALFVIDIQNDLTTDAATRVPHAARIRAAGDKVLSVARAVLDGRSASPKCLGMIVFVQHEEKPEDGPLVRGSDPWKLVFEPRADAPGERLMSKWTRKSKFTDRIQGPPQLAANSSRRRHVRIESGVGLPAQGSGS
jgi:nicotinamidase-related amidase